MKKIKSLFLSMIILMVFLMVFFLNNQLKQKKLFQSAFECGFNPIIKDQSKFSMNMFNFMLLFLILDTEIIFLIPFIKGENKLLLNFFFYWLINMILFSMMLEWMKMVLDWSK